MGREQSEVTLSERDIDLWHWGMEGLILLDIFLSSPHQFSFSKIAPFITKLVNNIKSSKIQFVENLAFYEEKMTATELAARLKRNPSHACQYIAALFHYVAVDFFSKPSMPNLQNLLSLPSDFQKILDAQKGNFRTDIAALPINRSGLTEYLAIREKVRDSIDYLLINGIVSADQYKIITRKVRHILNPLEPEKDHFDQMSSIVEQAFELWENKEFTPQERDLDIKKWTLEGLHTIFNWAHQPKTSLPQQSTFIEKIKVLASHIKQAGVTEEFNLENALRPLMHLNIFQSLAYHFINTYNWQQISSTLRTHKEVLYEYLAHTFLVMSEEILTRNEANNAHSNSSPIFHFSYTYQLKIKDLFQDLENRAIWPAEELEKVRAFVTTEENT